MHDQIGKNQHNIWGVIIVTHVALPREEHLKAAIHVISHVGQRYNYRLVFDPLYPEMDHNVFKECAWSEFYRDAKEAILVNVPEPWGKEVDICMFVDSDHAGDKVSHRSRSGFLIYVNTASVHWFSKKQSTLEMSVFGTEFDAMK